MRKTLKAFTLIEMIIVMAIFGILMSALMNFSRPVRQTFVDSTMIEDMRITQTGILNYLTESVRYAEQLVIYDDGANITPPSGVTITVNSPKKAYEAFIEQNSITKIEDQRRVQVVVINRKDGYSNTGNHAGTRANGFGGRIITNIIRDSGDPTASKFDDAAGARTKASSGDSFMVLGGGYYGGSDYAIFIDRDKTYPSGGYDSEHGGITFVVQTAMTDETGIVKQGADYGSSKVTVSGGQVFLTSSQSAYTMNNSNPEYYLNGNKKLPTNYSDSSAIPAGSIGPTGNITNPTSNTYIVVLEPDEKR